MRGTEGYLLCLFSYRFQLSRPDLEYFYNLSLLTVNDIFSSARWAVPERTNTTKRPVGYGIQHEYPGGTVTTSGPKKHSSWRGSGSEYYSSSQRSIRKRYEIQSSEFLRLSNPLPLPNTHADPKDLLLYLTTFDVPHLYSLFCVPIPLRLLSPTTAHPFVARCRCTEDKQKWGLFQRTEPAACKTRCCAQVCSLVPFFNRAGPIRKCFNGQLPCHARPLVPRPRFARQATSSQPTLHFPSQIKIPGTEISET
jgi:hypothetical protein